jgi:hypothetical protein
LMRENLSIDANGTRPSIFVYRYRTEIREWIRLKVYTSIVHFNLIVTYILLGIHGTSVSE